MSDGRGTSLAIARTEKGQQLFESVKSELKWKEVTYEEGVRGNSAEFSSAPRPQQRNTFFKDLENKSFIKLEKKYLGEPLWKRTGRIIKHGIKQIMWEDTEKHSNANYGILFTFKK